MLAAAPIDPRAALRSAGSDPVRARALAASLLAARFPAQFMRVRVDGVGAHRVAGVILSGVKFHGSLDEADFVAEIAEVAKRCFADSAIEEVDVWATVPLDAGQGAVVSGDLARPTSRNVFTLTVLRADAARVPALARSRDAYWDPAFRARLRR